MRLPAESLLMKMSFPSIGIHTKDKLWSPT